MNNYLKFIKPQKARNKQAFLNATISMWITPILHGEVLRYLSFFKAVPLIFPKIGFNVKILSCCMHLIRSVSLLQILIII